MQGQCHTSQFLRQGHRQQQAALRAGLGPSEPDAGHLQLSDAKLDGRQQQAVPEQPPGVARQVAMVCYCQKHPPAGVLQLLQAFNVMLKPWGEAIRIPAE